MTTTDTQQDETLECTCWFNKYGQLILTTWDCPRHGEKYEHERTERERDQRTSQSV